MDPMSYNGHKESSQVVIRSSLDQRASTVFTLRVAHCGRLRTMMTRRIGGEAATGGQFGATI